MTDRSEERLRAHLEEEDAHMAEQNARVDAWIERTKGAALSVRERFDGWAEVMRPSNIRLLEGATRLGWVPSREERAANIR